MTTSHPTRAKQLYHPILYISILTYMVAGNTYCSKNHLKDLITELLIFCKADSAVSNTFITAEHLVVQIVLIVVKLWSHKSSVHQALHAAIYSFEIPFTTLQTLDTKNCYHTKRHSFLKSHPWS